tara:strand:- start:1295 stop:2227 length:933 start_codon:yes stop_codon:yes gene_type:complete
MKSKDNNISFSKENYANIISENTSLIRKNWEKAIYKGNYIKYPEQNYILQIQTKSNTYKGLIGGISIKSIYSDVLPHEKVFEKRVFKLKDYLHKVKLQAEPVVIATSFTANLMNKIRITSNNQPDIFFKYNGNEYKIWRIYLSKENNLYDKGYIVDGHHRTASLLMLSNQENRKYKLLSYLIDASKINSNKYTWRVSKPSKNLILKLNKISSSQKEPDEKLFWAYYNNKYYKLNFTSVKNLEDWITLNGDEIYRYYKEDIKYNYESIYFNYPLISFNETISMANSGKLLPQKSTLFYPKMLTGLTISNLN